MSNIKNNKSIIAELYSKEKTVLFPRNPIEGEKQIELVFKPISLDEPALFKHMTEITNMKDNVEMDVLIDKIKPIIAYSLDIEIEDVNKFNLGKLKELFEVIGEINNFEKPKQKTTDITGFIKEKQTLMKNSELTKSITNVTN